MATEQYSIGYEEGYQAGWNAVMDSLQPAQQEPVAILNHAHGIHTVRSVKLNGLPDGEYNLYTSPPAQRKPLTDEEMEKIAAEYWLYPRKFVRAIEAAHGIKENT